MNRWRSATDRKITEDGAVSRRAPGGAGNVTIDRTIRHARINCHSTRHGGRGCYVNGTISIGLEARAALRVGG
jgi:hypothetical protein